MSYEIMYDRQFVKTSDGKIIPLVLTGSNNTYDPGPPMRRERHWWPLYLGKNENIAITEEELLARTEKYTGGYQEHFMRHNKWVDDDGLRRLIHMGIRRAGTLEELNDRSRGKVTLEGYFTVWYPTEGTHSEGGRIERSRREQFTVIRTDEDLDGYLAAAEDRIANRKPEESIYIGLRFPGEKAIPHPIAPQRPARTEYFVIRVVNTGAFIEKISNRHVWACKSTKAARQFETERAARTWLEKYGPRLEKALRSELVPQHVAEPA